jgi:hypothetical protein
MKLQLLLIGSFLLSACATNIGYSNDDKYKARVEHRGIQQGVQVIWVDPPKVEEPIIIEQHQEPEKPQD